MTGSSGGPWVDPPGDSCATLSQVTTLNSPSRNVLRRISKGDELAIQVTDIGTTVVVQAMYNSEVAGTITSSIIQRLAECVEKGFQYVAEVIENQGGACKVRVRAK